MSFIPQQEVTMSTALMLADLDDFLPVNRQDCIKPFLMNNNNSKQPVSSSSTTSEGTSSMDEHSQAAVGGGVSINRNPGSTNRRIGRNNNNRGGFTIDLNSQQQQEQQTKKIAKIELADCLACSGCVTTAESVLVNQQSVEQFLTSLKEMKLYSPFIEMKDEKVPNISDLEDDLDSILLSGSRGKFLKTQPNSIFIITISQQSAASLSSYYQCSSVRECLSRLSYLFKVKFGALAVFEMATLARLVSHLELCEDFLKRFKEGKGPVFASACPGWICYAEKTQPEIIDLISTVKSPQQIMGTFVKKFIMNHMKHLCSTSEISLEKLKVYHTTVMPCFDKKLEASRPDFTNDPFDKVDMVLTSSEITELLLKELQIETPEDFFRMTENFNTNNNQYQLDNIFEILSTSNGSSTQQQQSISSTHQFDNDEYPDVSLLEWLGSESDATGSGGYCEIVLKYAAKKLFGIDLRNTPLIFESKRNSDYRETVLVDPSDSSKVLLRFVIANGFRNIQNLVRRMKQSSSAENYEPFHFVEVMACPIGCLNGGGQVKVKQPKMMNSIVMGGDNEFSSSSAMMITTPIMVTPKQHLAQTEKLYREDISNIQSSSLVGNLSVRESLNNLYYNWIRGSVGSIQAKSILHTQYHAVAKLNIVTPTALKW